MIFQMTLLIGLCAALLMFCGDMLLYYDPADYVSNGKFDGIISIMKNVSEKRLYVGGIIGPIAAFLYCVGYWHIILMTTSRCQKIGMMIFGACCLGIIIGGAYHSHCSYLGLIGKQNDERAMNTIIQFFTFINKVSMLFQIVGLLGLFGLVISKSTILPWYFALWTPGILYLLLPVTRKLPKGIHIIICGGWGNLIFVIYYLSVLLYTVNR